MDGARGGDEEASSPEMTVTGDLDGAGAGSVKLHEKLRILYELKAELEKDIEALKRVVDILDES